MASALVNESGGLNKSELNLFNAIDPTTLTILVGVTSGLSILGSLFIIVTFICFKKIRSHGRFLIFNLSVMDLLTALAHVVGITVNFHNKSLQEPNSLWEGGCIAQGVVALFGTLGSILWTNALALYLFLLLVSRNPRVPRVSTYIMYVVCYMVPSVICIVLATAGDIGVHGSTAGWCSLKFNKSSKTFPYPFFVGEDLWVILSFVFLPFIIVSMKIYIWRARCLMKKGERTPLLRSSQERRITVFEWKLILVPIFFIFLRVWSLVVGIIFVYSDENISNSDIKSYHWLFYLSAIGDSGQGIANGILWCVLSVAVWQVTGQRLKSLGQLLAKCCHKKETTHHFGTATSSENGVTTSPNISPLDSFVSNENIQVTLKY